MYKTLEGLQDAFRALVPIANAAHADGGPVIWTFLPPTEVEGDPYAQVGYIGLQVKA